MREKIKRYNIRKCAANIGSALINSWYYLEHQQFHPCPNMIRDALSYARRSQDVFLTFLRFDRQCRINPDQVVIALIHIQMVVQHLLTLRKA